ncbi:hypothetical protein LTR66_002004 [Elasticomyces elasticus]|nr:hypothetical protein LTR66_002004 [Elasticomyces elasticus]
MNVVEHSHEALNPEGPEPGESVFEMTQAIQNTSELHRRDDDWGIVKQKNAPWHLAMTSSNTRGTPGIDITDTDYFYPRDAGLRVSIYIFDSGIRLSHSEFEGRAVNFKGRSNSIYADNESNDDVRGHGTHVAGLAGGKTYGVAKKVQLVNVKVSGSKGVQRPLFNHALGDVLDEHNGYMALEEKEKSGNYRGGILNFSLGGLGDSEALRELTTLARKMGMIVVASSGNYGNDLDITPVYPCSWPGARVVCVGAVDKKFQELALSSYGSTVSILAPGNVLKSAAHFDDNATAGKTGTSMAAPIVSGLLATFCSVEGCTARLRHADVGVNRLLGNAQIGWLAGPHTPKSGLRSYTKNILANNGAQRVGKGPVHQPYLGGPIVVSHDEF